MENKIHTLLFFPEWFYSTYKFDLKDLRISSSQKQNLVRTFINQKTMDKMN